MATRDMPRAREFRPPHSVVFPAVLDAIIEKLHESTMPSRMKARMAIDLAHVHEVEGRVVEAIVGYETAAFFCRRAQVTSALRRLRRKLLSAA